MGRSDWLLCEIVPLVWLKNSWQETASNSNLKNGTNPGAGQYQDYLFNIQRAVAQTNLHLIECRGDPCDRPL